MIRRKVKFRRRRIHGIIKNRRYKQKKKNLVIRVSKQSAYVAAWWKKRLENSTKKRESQKYLEMIYDGLRQNYVQTPGQGSMYMKFGRRSFHLGFSRKKEIKNKSRFAKKKKNKWGFELEIKKSIGQLKMFKGRARSSAVARKTLARLFVKDLIKRHAHIIDLCLKSEMGKHYFAVISALAKKNLVIRNVTRLVSRPHGYMRKRKQRRT